MSHSILVMLVDTNDKADIERHIARLELIRDGIKEPVRPRILQTFGLPEAKEVRLIDVDGTPHILSREANPKLLLALDYLYDDPEANQLSLRELEAIVSVSKTMTQKAKHYWMLPENREAYARFREGTPF